MRTGLLQQINEGDKLLLHVVGDLQLWKDSVSVLRKKHLTMSATQHQILTLANERLQHPDQGPRNGEMFQTLAFFLSFLPPFFPSSSSKSNTKSCKIETLQIQHIQSKLPKFHPTLPQAIIVSILVHVPPNFLPAYTSIVIITVDFSQNGVIHYIPLGDLPC